MKRVGFLAMLLVALGGSAALAGVPPWASSADPEQGVIQVRGHQEADGSYCVQLVVGQIVNPQQWPDYVIKGLVVYSEPSHTLIAAVGEPDVNFHAAPRVFVRGPAAGAPILCSSQSPPSGDTGILIRLVRPAGEMTIVDGTVSMADFAYSVTLNPQPDMIPLWTCCGCGNNCMYCEPYCIHPICRCPGCQLNCGD
jgi:hypothetical protein